MVGTEDKALSISQLWCSLLSYGKTQKPLTAFGLFEESWK